MEFIEIRPIRSTDNPEWLRMRTSLWDDHSESEMLAEMHEIIATPDDTPVFVAQRANGKLGGFLEGGTRKYADGCDTSPVGYIEGWYVEPDLRQQGVGGRLVKTFETWVRGKGLVEIGSDTWLDNETSIEAHQRLGYVLMERLAHFGKKLD